jgi:two-component system OmpR family sensor kinase/two-component system sensor histidine kinase BaeS
MADAFQPLANQQAVTLSVAPPTHELSLFVDPDRLHQTLHNLLGNALRHTPANGNVRLGAQAAADQSVRFWVQDSGPGIVPEDLPHVFDRFYRAQRAPDASRADYTSGTGLGLAIVKALVEAHNGRVGVESRPGVGATFWFELPLGS